jgi:SAM-dependent methyltransferase
MSDSSNLMDFYAQAVINFYITKRPDFEFEFQDGNRYPHDLSRYFRTLDELQPIETKIINMCSGKILDIGSSTGYYLPFMSKYGPVTGLEISHRLVEFCNEHYSKDLIQGDIFTHKFNAQFDTITLLENNLGICKNVDGLMKLIAIFNKILSPQGQILIMTKKYNKVNYEYNFNNIATLTPYWNGKKGESFDWITFDEDYITKVFHEKGFRTEQVFLDGDNLLLKIVRV